jgi:sugar lactone lactonase YvrE
VVIKGVNDLYRVDIHTQKVVKYNYTGLYFPMSVTLDMSEKLMFWSDLVAHNIYKAGLDGSNQTIIKNGKYILFYKMLSNSNLPFK